jgi:hypothetical protein
VDGKERGEETERRAQWRKNAREREKEKRKPSPPSRIESELDLRLLGIKTFETSTGQQDRLQLNHSSSRTSFTPSWFGISLLPCLYFHRSNFHRLSSALSLLSVSPGPIGPGPSPLPILSPSSSRIVFVSSLSLLRYRVPISGPLGFTWRALMTSRNERVPPPSNKTFSRSNANPPGVVSPPSAPPPCPASPSASRFFIPHVASRGISVCTK